MNTVFIEKYNDLTIEIFNDYTYTSNSNDNVHKYSFEYYFDDSYITSKHGIIVKNSTITEYSAILLGNGGSTTIHKKSYCIDDNTIIICCGNALFSLALPELKLNWKKVIDSATAFEIYKMNTDYIIHGELEISRINNLGNIIWKKSGSDIFATQDGNNDFKIIGNNIYAKSWDGKEYKYNYEGENMY